MEVSAESLYEYKYKLLQQLAKSQGLPSNVKDSGTSLSSNSSTPVRYRKRRSWSPVAYGSGKRIRMDVRNTESDRVLRSSNLQLQNSRYIRIAYIHNNTALVGCARVRQYQYPRNQRSNYSELKDRRLQFLKRHHLMDRENRTAKASTAHPVRGTENANELSPFEKINNYLSCDSGQPLNYEPICTTATTSTCILPYSTNEPGTSVPSAAYHVPINSVQRDRPSGSGGSSEYVPLNEYDNATEHEGESTASEEVNQENANELSPFEKINNYLSCDLGQPLNYEPICTTATTSTCILPYSTNEPGTSVPSAAYHVPINSVQRDRPSGSGGTSEYVSLNEYDNATEHEGESTASEEVNQENANELSPVEKINNYLSCDLGQPLNYEPICTTATTSTCILPYSTNEPGTSEPSAAYHVPINSVQRDRPSGSGGSSEYVPLNEYDNATEHEGESTASEEVNQELPWTPLSDAPMDLEANTIEDALDIISQDGNYLERIGMEIRMRCVLCDWTGARSIIEYHIGLEHPTSVIERSSPKWSSTISLASAGCGLRELSKYDNRIFVLSVACVGTDRLQAVIGILPKEDEPTEQMVKYGRLKIHDGMTGELFSWEGVVPIINEFTDEEGLNIELARLKLVPYGDLMFASGQWVFCSGKEAVQIDVSEISIVVHVQIYENKYFCL